MDKKAKQILFNKFWSSSGWKENRDIETADFEYAKSKGLMFDPVEIDHDTLSTSIVENFIASKKKEIVNGFVSSLTTRNLEFRSFLSSYAVAKVYMHHKYITSCGRMCDQCGLYGTDIRTIDINVLNFEKLKWGGVRLGHLIYLHFDLMQMSKAEFPIPNAEDRALLIKLKNLILNSAGDDRPRQLEKRMGKLLKSNAAEREVILNIFGICGILETKDQKGFLDNFIPYKKRELRPVNKTDWSYPVDWWQGMCGINEEAWNYYFD